MHSWNKEAVLLPKKVLIVSLQAQLLCIPARTLVYACACLDCCIGNEAVNESLLLSGVCLLYFQVWSNLPMTQKWEISKPAAQWPEGSKALEATSDGGKKVVLIKTEILTLWAKTQGLGTQWDTESSSCKHCSNNILTYGYLLNFSLFYLTKIMYFKRGQISDYSQVVSTTLPFEEVETPRHSLKIKF